MKKLRHSRWLSLSTVAVAMALITGVPAGALAAGDQSGASAATGEGATEPAGGTESSPPAEGSSPPASTGWVPPQGEAAEDTGDTAAPTRRGSSLGSGGSSHRSASRDEQPAPSEQPVPTPASSGYEPEASSPSTFEEPVSTHRAVPTVDAEPRAAEPATEAAPIGVGAANPVATTPSPQGATRPAPPVEATPVADTGEQAAAGSGGLLWPLLIVCILILLYAGARLLLGPVELDIFRSSPFRRVRRVFPRA